MANMIPFTFLQVVSLSLGRLFSVPTVFLILSLLTGCAARQQDLYYWGEYEDSLNDRYVANDTSQTEQHLLNTLQNAATNNLRTPPGLNADYGFMLYSRGDKASANAHFEKERQLYPESTALMTKLIEKVNQQAATKAPVINPPVENPEEEKQ